MLDVNDYPLLAIFPASVIPLARSATALSGAAPGAQSHEAAPAGWRAPGKEKGATFVAPFST